MSTEEKKPEGKKGLSAKDQEILTDSPFIKRAHEFCARPVETTTQIKNV